MTIKSISGMIIDGVAASEAIDSSGEILDVKGCDISDLENGVGVLNYEHRGDDANGASPNDVVGKIIFAKKIFKKDDCEDKRQEYYWDKVKLPLIYIKARLYDGAGHPGAIAAAAMIRDHHANNEPILARYSIEGSTLKKEGNRLVRSMARKVALTLKPCNKSAISGLLADPNGPIPVTEKQATKSLLEELADTVKSEFASYEMEVDPLVKEEPIVKAMEAGGYDAAPSTLTQGSALQREDLGPAGSLEAHRERIRNQLKAALRDYDPVEHKDTGKFLKMYLPEADQSYEDYFENLIGDIKTKGLRDVIEKSTRNLEYWSLEFKRLMKTGTVKETSKEEGFGDVGGPAVPGENGTPVPPAQPEAPADSHPALQPAATLPDLPEGIVRFNGIEVRPGAATVNRDMGVIPRGSKVAVVGGDHNGYYVVPLDKIKDFKPEDVVKIRAYDITVDRNHEMVGGSIVDAARHAHPDYTFQPEQKKLMHGIDMSRVGEAGEPQDQDFRQGIVLGVWRKVLGGTEMAYVKPHAGGPSAMPSNPEAEGLYHNLMHQFFNTGKYIPTVAVFRSPEDGHLYHVIRKVPQAEHYSGSPTQRDTLEKLHNSGELDKLLLTNSLLTNSDRHHNNFMFGNGNKDLFMIDHGYTLHGRHGSVNGYFPAYYSEVASKLAREHGLGSSFEIKLNPEARNWLLSLDGAKLNQILTAHKVPPEVHQNTLERFYNMQNWVKDNPDAGAIEAYAAAEPHSRKFQEAKEFRERHDPAFLAAERERKRLEKEEQRREAARADKAHKMVGDLADLKDQNPALAIHDLAQLGGFDPDARHALIVPKGMNVQQLSPDARAQWDANLDRMVRERLAENQQAMHAARWNLINEEVANRRAFPPGHDNREGEIFRPMVGEELDVLGKRYGFRRQKDEEDTAYRKRIEDDLMQPIREQMHRADLEEAHGINENRDAAAHEENYKATRRNMAAAHLRQFGLDKDYIDPPSEEKLVEWMPSGKDLDMFAKAFNRRHKAGIPLREGMSDEQYKPLIAKEMLRQHNWNPPFVQTIRDRADSMANHIKSQMHSILDYMDGGLDVDKLKERLVRGLNFNVDGVKDMLAYFGLPVPKNQDEKKAIVDELYTKLINDPKFEIMAKARAKRKAIAAYAERQERLAARGRRVAGQAKRKRAKVGKKVQEQKPVIQQMMDDPNRKPSHGTPEHMRMLREAVAELEAKNQSTAPEQERLFPKE